MINIAICMMLWFLQPGWKSLLWILVRRTPLTYVFILMEIHYWKR